MLAFFFASIVKSEGNFHTILGKINCKLIYKKKSVEDEERFDSGFHSRFEYFLLYKFSECADSHGQ